MSVVVVATIHPRPGEHEAVKAAFLETIPLVHAEDGCELYALHEKDDRLVMVEQWSGPEALAVHSKAAALAALGPKLAGRSPRRRTSSSSPPSPPATRPRAWSSPEARPADP